MPLRENNKVEYPGAGTVVVPPCDVGCCCDMPSVDEVVRHYNENGIGGVIKGGVGRVNATLAEVVTACEGTAATITFVLRAVLQIFGTEFGVKTGLAKLEVDAGAGWAERGTTNWADTVIVHAAPQLNIGDKVRVRTTCGAYSNVFVIAFKLG